MMMQTTILLVEDDRLVRHTLVRGLQDAGYRVIDADSGEAAMTLCADVRPDIALLDMRLPGMSGVDFALWLKSAASVPFLFLSAYDDPETVRKAAELGALGYLVKPLIIQQVIPSIQTALLRAQELEKFHRNEINLSTALKTSRNLSIAIGLCMERFGIGADESFEALRTYSRSHREKMVDIADQIVEHKQDIDLLPFIKKR
jgi:response regulator NasT